MELTQVDYEVAKWIDLSEDRFQYKNCVMKR
jgi:hypothetical protein